MTSVIDAGEVLEIKVGVHLRRGDVRVTEQFLDPAQILTRLEQVRGEGVAEKMGMHVHRQALQPCPAGDTQLDRALSGTTTVATDEQRRFADAGHARAAAAAKHQGLARGGEAR